MDPGRFTEVVTEFGKLTGVAVIVVQGRGHDLGKDYVGPLLDRLNAAYPGLFMT